MKRDEIALRDPFVLNDNGIYYLYGTRSATAWSEADGFDVYVSSDLENWSDAKVIFHNDGSFWATKEYWAPECVKYRGSYYLLATFGSDKRKKGVQILKSDAPDGTFVPLTEYPITPDEWESLDGTLYVDENDIPWLIFSHSVPEELRGAMCALQLSQDLAVAIGEPQILFYTCDAPWTRPIPFAKAEFNIDEDAYFSDGPYIFHDEKGRLSMLFSSWSERGYAMAISISDNGRMDGKWDHQPMPLSYGGGHGMVFKSKTGENFLTYHSPNDYMKERPVFVRLSECHI